MIDIKRRFADTPEGQVHYRVAGAGDPLILMHWAPGCGRQHERVLPLFAQRGYTALAPDLMGYGDSDKPDRQWSIADFAANLGHFMDALSLESAFLYGGHATAAVATEFAITATGRVRRLVLDGSPIYDAKERAENAGTYAKPLQLSKDGEHMLWAWRRSFRQPTMPLEEVFAATLDLLKAGFTWHTGYEAVFGYDMASRLPLLRVPVLAMTSTDDPLYEANKVVMAQAPQVVEHVTENRSALAPGERAQQFVAVIDEFLRSSAS